MEILLCFAPQNPSDCDVRLIKQDSAMGLLSSYFKALRASRCYGAALKLQRKGNIKKALRYARKGLEHLSSPGVRRGNPAEASVLVHLTLFIQHYAPEVGEQAATEKDLNDTYLIIKEHEGAKYYNEYSEWLPFIKDKLGYEPTQFS